MQYLSKICSTFRKYNKDDFITLIKQIVKFGLVGAASFIISMLFYYGILWLNEDYYILGYALAFIVGVLNTYYLHNRFVFRKTEKGHAKPLIKAFLSYGITFFLGIVTLFVMVNFLGISKAIAPLINLTYTVPINFLLNRLWTFK